MDLDDFLDDDFDLEEDLLEDDYRDDCLSQEIELENEGERSNGDRSTYLNRELIFSNRYIDALKTLGESRYCCKNILDSSRAMLEHHHGDKYEDLYFIDSVTNQILARTDYRINEQEVLPTAAMKTMARNSPNIISIHNHPANGLPSFEDIKSCYLVGYKYGLVMCHNGDIFQYKTLDDLNRANYESSFHIYYKREHNIAIELEKGEINLEEFKIKHQENFIKLSKGFLDAGVLIKEVLWNGKPQL